MSNSKKKYVIAWNEQTEKLKQKLFSLAENDLFEQDKLNVVSQLQEVGGKSKSSLKYI